MSSSLKVPSAISLSLALASEVSSVTTTPASFITAFTFGTPFSSIIGLSDESTSSSIPSARQTPASVPATTVSSAAVVSSATTGSSTTVSAAS